MTIAFQPCGFQDEAFQSAPCGPSLTGVVYNDRAYWTPLPWHTENNSVVRKISAKVIGRSNVKATVSGVASLRAVVSSVSSTSAMLTVNESAYKQHLRGQEEELIFALMCS